MKKAFALLLTLTLSVSLVACSNTPPVASTSEAETATLAPSESDTSLSENTDPSTVVGDEVRIKDVFAEHGIKAGTCISSQMLGYVEQINIIKDNFNSVTMENSMKPEAILNKSESIKQGEPVVEFNKEASRILNFAQKNNMSMRGHTLVWYSQTPSWLFYEDFNQKNSLVSREVMLERMETYIRKVFELIENSGYTDLFYAYDVVNEAWMEDGKMRECLWKDTIGDDYLWYAFYFANKYAPESIDLYYNDYNEQYKADTLIKFVNTLVDENGEYLIDGIGLQAHLYTGDTLDSYFNMIDRLSSTGLKIQVTELDVCLGSWQHPDKATDENFKKQGRYYYNLLNGLFERIDNGTLNMDAITFWGFGDDASWRSEYSPLLYDLKLNPKPAYYGALQNRDLAGFSN